MKVVKNKHINLQTGEEWIDWSSPKKVGITIRDKDKKLRKEITDHLTEHGYKKRLFIKK